MEWSYEDMVRWAILNLNVDESIIARVRSKYLLKNEFPDKGSPKVIEGAELESDVRNELLIIIS
jgi:hypothetical protein